MTENDSSSSGSLFPYTPRRRGHGSRGLERDSVYGRERLCRICNEWLHESLFTKAGRAKRFDCSAAANGCEAVLRRERHDVDRARSAQLRMLERRRVVFDSIDGVPRWRLYLLVFPDGELYVGLTDNPVRREAEHRRDSHNVGVTALARSGKRWRMQVIGAYPSQADGLAAEDAWMDRLRSEGRTVLNERRNTRLEASL